MASLTEQNISAIEKQSEGKPYAVFAKNLKDSGVILYVVTVSNHDRKFFTEVDELLIKGSLPVINCADNFQINEVRNAVRRNQQVETDYPQFLKEIANAGVHTYIADFNAMQVIYKGKDEDDDMPNLFR